MRVFISRLVLQRFHERETVDGYNDNGAGCLSFNYSENNIQRGRRINE